MYNVEAEHIADAHKKALKLIIEEGEVVVTEDKQETLELSEPLGIIVRSPLDEPMVHPNNPLSRRALNDYIPQLLTPVNNGFAYTYGSRLMNYPLHHDPFARHNLGNSMDQLKVIHIHQENDPTTRRAIAHTWIVGADHMSKTPPCLQTVQFVMRSNRVNLIASFRSNDICTAWGGNAFALSHLLKDYSFGLCATGYLQTISTCAHLYLTDIDTAKRIAYG